MRDDIEAAMPNMAGAECSAARGARQPDAREARSFACGAHSVCDGEERMVVGRFSGHETAGARR